MNNLKRIFSLGLATVMVIGMMVTGASAAFTDADSIEKTDAANTVVALGIMSGDLQADGTLKFDAKGDVTRAQFATMIAMALNGGKDFRGSSVTGYPDVDGTASAWAGKFIKYCIDKEIISGKVPGKVFDPTGKVTAQEASAMILLAMGFKKAQLAAPAGSADWAVKINERAESAKLYNDTDVVDYSEAINRENAAQMIYNGILAGTPKWEEVYDSEKGTTYKMTSANGGDPILKTVFKAEIKYSVLTGTSLSDDTYSYTLDSTGITVDPLKDADNTVTLKSKTDYSGLFRQKVQVIYSDSSAVVTSNATVISIVPAHNNVIGSGVWGDVELSTDNKKVNGVALNDTANTIPVYPFNGNTTGKLNNTGASTVYYAFDMIDNTGDNKVDAIVTYPVSFGTVSYVGATQFTVSNVGTYTTEKVDVYEGIAKGDYVLVTTDSANNNAVKVEKLTAETITVDAIKDTGSLVRADGKWLDASQNSTYNTLKAMGKFDVVMVNGYVMAAKAASTGTSSSTVGVSDVFMVTAIGDFAKASDYKDTPALYPTRILTAAGEITEINVGKIGSNTVDDTTYKPAKNTLYTAKQEKDGTYTLTEVKATANKWNELDVPTTAGTIAITDKGQLTNTTSGPVTTTYRINDDAVVFVYSTGEFKAAVIKGSDLKIWDPNTAISGATIFTSETNGFDFIDMALVNLGAADALPGQAATTGWGWITSSAIYTLVGEKSDIPAYELEIFDGETTRKVIATEANETISAANAGNYAKAVFVTFDEGEDGIITNLKVLSATAKAVTAWDGVKTLKLDNGSEIVLDNTWNIMYVDTKEGKGVEGGSIQMATKTEAGTYVKNVYHVGKYLIVDVNNNLKINNGISKVKVEKAGTVTAIADDGIDATKKQIKITGTIERSTIAADPANGLKITGNGFIVIGTDGKTVTADDATVGAGCAIRIFAEDGSSVEYLFVSAS